MLTSTFRDNRMTTLLSLASSALLVACSPAREAGRQRDTLVVYLAASLTKPMQPMLDSFGVHTNTVIHRESGGSLEHARKITELGRVPDVIALADEEVFPQLLVPNHASWYAIFARNRMVIAYTDRSRHANEIRPDDWTTILARPDVQVGRTDPDLAPAGYRTLIMLQLAERYYHEPGLADRLLANAPKRNMRGNAAELAALLRAGELDYIYEYESLAASNGFRSVHLPPEIDLGDPAFASRYREASVRVRGAKPTDTTTMTGRPVLYALSVPRQAPHPGAAERFVEEMLAAAGRRRLREQHIDMLDTIRFVGDPPAALRAAAGR
jgi:molybdate/tungstate transport system substrate-binding protein